MTPLICFGAGVVLYSLGSLAFWRVLAYLAVLHFVRQQYGFVMLYRHRAGERGSIDALIDKVAIYAVMLYPLAYWHARDDRVFAWFVAGDFAALPAWTAGAAGVLYATALLAFALRQAQRALRGEPLSWGKLGIVASTAATWYVGIVAFNSDFAFTVTNVVAHGLPYLALVWLYGRRKWTAPKSWRTRLYRPALLWAFVGAAILLAYLEEGAWDLLVWHEHASLFGDWQLPALPKELLAVIVPLLILPQATHYVLDAWIWKFDGSNQGLRGYLFGDSEPPRWRLKQVQAVPADRTRGVPLPPVAAAPTNDADGPVSAADREPARAHAASARRRRGPTSWAPSGRPLAPCRSGRLSAGIPQSVHSVQKVGSPVEARPAGAVPEAVGVRIAS